VTKNVTIRLDEAILKKCRHRAIEDDKSLSQWITDVLVKVVSEKEQYEAARKRSIQRMERGFHLGGKALPRGESHER
jgi:hypothetical protein